MKTKVLELEGTAAEIRALLPDAPGKRLRVTAQVIETETEIELEREAATEPKYAPKMTITEKILARAKQIPPEERGKLPTDLSENLDHYLYGWPKK